MTSRPYEITEARQWRALFFLNDSLTSELVANGLVQRLHPMGLYSWELNFIMDTYTSYQISEETWEQLRSVTQAQNAPAQKQRCQANARERDRTQSVNMAFTTLRHLIPTEPADRKLSKIEVLRLAGSYITHLDNQLYTDFNQRGFHRGYGTAVFEKIRHRIQNIFVYVLLVNFKKEKIASNDKDIHCSHKIKK